MKRKAIQISLNEIEEARLGEESKKQQLSIAEVIRRMVMIYLPYSKYEIERDLVRPGRPFALDEDRLYEVPFGENTIE